MLKASEKAASFELVVEIPEKEPADFLTTVEPSNDGTGIVNFSMSATNASSYKIEIFEQDGVTLIHEENNNKQLLHLYFC